MSETPATQPSTSLSGLEWPTDATQYNLTGKIGQGAFASVWRASDVAEVSCFVSFHYATPYGSTDCCRAGRCPVLSWLCKGISVSRSFIRSFSPFVSAVDTYGTY